jgi:hypothetical protein
MPSINAARNTQDSVLEQRQREAREKTLQKKRGMLAQQLAQQVASQEENVMTDNEEEPGYGGETGEESYVEEIL